MENIRSFIAIELPPEAKSVLARVQDKLKSRNGASVKWVDPAIMHLTLKFLGNVNSDLIAKITAAIEQASRGVHPFAIELSGLGVFPNERRVRVVWVGLTGEVEMLAQLQKNIDIALAPLGFPAEARPFTPHLTLARVREEAGPEERQSLGQLVAATALEGSGGVNIQSVHLMKSQLTREGPIYTRISSVALK